MKAALLVLAVTAYVPANPIGATGEPILADVTMAVPREHRHLLGSWVYVEGHGPRYVNDITNARIKGNVDLAVDSLETAKAIGRQPGRKIWTLKLVYSAQVPGGPGNGAHE